MQHLGSNWVAIGHCCFEAHVADTERRCLADLEHHPLVCGCFDRGDAEKIAAACRDLAKVSENIVEIMVDLGCDRVGSYREDLDAVRKAQAAVDKIAKTLSPPKN